MRRLATGLIVASLWALPILAQEPERSLERISIALQQPSPSVSSFPLPESPGRPTKLGVFTLVPPTGRGEIIRVSLPIGELVSRVFRGVSAATQRRQEAAARRTVAADLQLYLQQRER